MAAEGEKRGAMEAEGAVEKGGDVAATSEKGEAASAKGKGVAEAKEVAGGKMVILRSSQPEKKRYEVPEAAARLSMLIGEMLDGDCANDDGIVIPVTARTLDTVVEYCSKHFEATKSDSDPFAAAATKSDPNPSAEASVGGGVNTAASENLEDWDRKLVDRLSMDDLYDVIHAANFLDIKGLLDVVYQRVADMIKGKTPDEIRATFNIANDFTPEEEEELRQQCAWIFDAE
ncbi:SKP1-like protein 1B [Panicum miliaceum]|uniref:SKP1-like protein 1B n=1 Tax=Panicum miliaceum TaxID=4540 RepID=A0A3L6QUG3_PANMI|nr:SKP1-like protein 1B [Panicum miliaceum]